MRCYLLGAALACLPLVVQAQQLPVPVSMAPEPPIPYPMENATPASAAKAALLQCVKGAVVPTWHTSCVIRSTWGSQPNPQDPPPPHSAAFLRAALTEAAAQTKRYRTRENAAYTLAASKFDAKRQNISYQEFLDILGRAFRAIPKPGSDLEIASR
jgi:hypothetical protein